MSKISLQFQSWISSFNSDTSFDLSLIFSPVYRFLSFSKASRNSKTRFTFGYNLQVVFGPWVCNCAVSNQSFEGGPGFFEVIVFVGLDSEVVIQISFIETLWKRSWILPFSLLLFICELLFASLLCSLHCKYLNSLFTILHERFFETLNVSIKFKVSRFNLSKSGCVRLFLWYFEKKVAKRGLGEEILGA